MDSLFLPALRVDDDKLAVVTSEGLVGLFLLQCLQNPSIQVNLVIQHSNHDSIKKSSKDKKTSKHGLLSENSIDNISKGLMDCKVNDDIKTSKNLTDIITDNVEDFKGFPVNLKHLLFDVHVLMEDELDNAVRNCILPAAYLPEKSKCIAGLCASLRHVLNVTTKLPSSKNLSNSLLGFRGGCLQACAEVSVWTKFCELDALHSLEILMNDLCSVPTNITIPIDLLRFEQHLKCPPIVHNALKKKQENIRDGTNDSNAKKNLFSKKLSDLPDLQHNYAEGLSMTLADVMLFVCFHICIKKLSPLVNLESVCPLTLAWHDRIMTLDYVKKAQPLLKDVLSLCHYVKVNELITPMVSSESLYKCDRERYKSRWRAFTHQKDIDSVVGILDNAGINPQYDKHPAGDDLDYNWDTMPPEVSPHAGQLPASRLKRKLEQLENIAVAVETIAKPGMSIVDFCSGGGHLGILLAYRLPHCQVLFVENKESSLVRAEERSNSLNLKNVQFYQCNLDYFKGSFDVGIALHACGVATDLVIDKCTKSRACAVVVPCCYGGVKVNHILNYPRSQIYKTIGLSSSQYLIIGHAADQTHDEDNPKTAQGRLCMRLIDTDRLKGLVEQEYRTRLCLMQPSSCSPKNHLLIAVPQ